MVFHQAAQVSVPLSIKEPALTRKINVDGTRNVLEAALGKDVKRVVFASSAAIYGELDRPAKESDELRPQNPYGESKKEAEALMRSYFEENGLETVCLRYFNVYGPRQTSGVISLFFRSMLASTPPAIYGDGKQARDFIYVKDVADANMMASSADVAGESFNIGTGKPATLLSLLELMKKVTNKKLEPVFHPAREGDVRYSCADVSKASEILKFDAKTTLEEGLRKLQV